MNTTVLKVVEKIAESDNYFIFKLYGEDIRINKRYVSILKFSATTGSGNHKKDFFDIEIPTWLFKTIWG